MFSPPDACRAVGTLARLADALPKSGGMAAVEVAPEEPRLGEGAAIAAVNGPRAVAVSRHRETVAEVCAEWAGRGRRTHVLRLDVAPHSPLFDPLLDDDRRTLAALDLRPPRLPLISDTTAEPVGAEAASPGFWVRAMRAPVRFADAVARMHRDGVTAYLELGPVEVLTGMLDGCLSSGADRRSCSP
ncbi:acyltransferase domain-containing protein [Streptomyces guryensis]|uniref:Acyltransferase domain-containing protein n=1 Tax=Streptomyces guryensis TaxID=2886947 RepID=A0A9Q3VPC7_9ACTN|nr:acyltransferase domain-containing protein [Streptomyces guryensis]MCD9874580.1 acyltransferase domain-containing protein [Streptomyces guryensis]